ncbi:proliferating cell nuclear antigen [Hortaea werneckii]|nr:proliferating cell nuclear antigen [Hortaea werneckii]
MHQLPSLIPIVMRLLLVANLRTESLRPLALQKLTRYLSEKVRATGSDRLISTLRSGFSTSVCERSVTAPEPMSPLQANLTPSLVHSMDTVCPSILWNSELGMLMVAAYSVSGMPKCSWSMSISLMSYSLSLSLSALSKTMFTTSGASSAFRVDTEGDVTVAAERREGLGLQHHGHESHMGVVHGLEGDAGVIAVEVAVLDQVLDGVDDLFDDAFHGQVRGSESAGSLTEMKNPGALRRYRLTLCTAHRTASTDPLLAGRSRLWGCFQSSAGRDSSPRVPAATPKSEAVRERIFEIVYINQDELPAPVHEKSAVGTHSTH